MSKVNNSITQVKKANKTNKPPSWKLHPILLKGVGSVILAGFSLLIKYQAPQFVVTISTDVCPSDQDGKTLIRVDFSIKDVADLEKSIIPFVNKHE